MNELNISIQGMNRIVNEIFGKITAFKRSLRLWELQTMTQFSIMRTAIPTDAVKYAEHIQLLQLEFNSRFQDICKSEAKANIFSTAFGVNVETVPADSIQRRQMSTVIRISGINLGTCDSLTFITILLCSDHGRGMIRFYETHMFVK